jgi:hypothetical protein
MKKAQKLILSTMILNCFTCFAEEDSLYVACSSEDVFCCEKNGKEVYVVMPHDIWGEYNYINANAFCSQNFGATVASHNTIDIDPKELLNAVQADRQPAEYSDFP